MELGDNEGIDDSTRDGLVLRTIEGSELGVKLGTVLVMSDGTSLG